ncbi:twitchin-like isoform X2 [Varroa jacobsoni]|uniref:twitchin-like isoform X2 n=1 Tax=Varroa jacobsoni TaxID=62625 RepID=UPI000BF5CD0E|nr:twitchin-like isoform X2 [Varroa jacobsoni]
MYIPASSDAAPGPPDDLVGEYDFEADLVRLRWESPQDYGGSKINSYLVERCTEENGVFQEVGYIDPGQLSFVDGDILENSEYFYRVLALNDNGISEPSSKVKVFTKCLIDLPDPPEGPLHITCTTSRSCSLSWRQPISGPVEGYSIWKRRQDTDQWGRIMTVEGDIQECTIQNLDNHYRYSFKVHSENRAGSSLVALKTASLVNLKTGTRKPNAPRGPLVPTVTGPSSMYVEWGPCENDGGAPLQGYAIWIREVTRRIWIEVGNVEADVCIFTARDLLEGHEYLVRVAAINELGVSPPLLLESPIAIIRPKGVVVPPSAPRGPVNVKNISATSMMVSWKTPLEDGGGPIEAYIIEQREILEADVVKSHHETDGPETFLIVNGLTQGHYYCFRVYAVNEAGVGEALVGKIPTRAKTASIRPPQPDAPTVEVCNSKPRSVVVSWPAVEVEVTCYLVERSRLDEEDWQLVSPPADFCDTKLLCDGLFPGIEYVFRVSAENEHGIGRASRISEPIAVTAGNIREPGFTKDLQDLTALAGDLIQFDVEFYGEPGPEVVWTRDGTLLEASGRFEVLSVEGASSLRISPVMMEDEGGLACQASNVAGNAHSKATLSVHARPEILPVARYSQGLCFDAGDPLSIKLPYVGSPKPTAIWLHNGAPFDLSREGVTACFDCGNALLEIEEVDRNLQGVYSLKIDNQYGSAQVDVLVTVTGEPDPPVKLHLSDFDDVSCVIRWQSPSDDGGSPITSYVIEQLGDGESLWEKCGTTQALSYNVCGLKEGSVYQFRVSSVNIFGRSRPSRPTAPIRMSPEAEYVDDASGKDDSVPSSSVSVQGGYQDSIFQDISARQQEGRPDIRPEFWAAPEETSPDSCVPETFIGGGSQPVREWDEVTLIADDTLDSVSEFSTYQNTGYYSASPVGTAASSNDTALDIEMSELMNLVTHDCSGSEHDATVVQRTPASHPSPMSHQSLTIQASSLAEAEEMNLVPRPSQVLPQQVLTGPVGISSTSESPVMTVIEANGQGFEDVVEEICEDEVTVMPIGAADADANGKRRTSYADSVAEITDDEECLEDIRVREELAEVLTEPSHLHVAKNGRQPEVKDGVPLIAFERRASILENIHEIDEISLKDPVSEASDRLLASLSKAANATDNCIQLLERSPQAHAESNCSSISDIASLEDFIGREYGDREQRIESLEYGLGMEMASLERDLKSLQKILDHGSDEGVEYRSNGMKESSQQLSREIGQQAELYNNPYQAYYTGVLPKFFTEWKAPEKKNQADKQHTAPAKKRFYAEKTGSIFSLPSPSSSESELSIARKATVTHYGTKMSGTTPKVISHLQNRLIQVGCRVKLSCAIDGDPCPQISWFQNGNPLKLKNRHFIVSMLDFGLCTLEIYNAKNTDTGEYSVVAKNRFGHCTTSAYLRVTGGREESPERPIVWRATETVQVTTGAEIAELRWRVAGWPLPSIHVYLGEDRIRTDLHRDVTFLRGGVCHVKVFRPSEADYGVYTCVASNRLGRAAATIVLRQIGEPSTLGPAGSNIDPLADLPTSTRNRDCNLPLGFYDPDVTGGPFPEYVEDLFEKPVCWFRTHHVPFLRNLQRNVKELPELRKLPWPPLNVKFTEIDRNSVTLCWEKPLNDGGAKVFDFRVEAREIHTRNWREKATSRSSIVTVYSLKPGTTYVFRVSARNKYGEGQAQVSEPVTTRV